MHVVNNKHKCALFTKDYVKGKLSRHNSYELEECELKNDVFTYETESNAKSTSKQNDNNELLADVISGLTSLGYKKQQARKHAIEALKAGKTTIEDIIKFSLQLAKNKK